MKSRKEKLGIIMVIIGFTLILVKAIDYFTPGKALVPGLTLIGIILVAIGLILHNKK